MNTVVMVLSIIFGCVGIVSTLVAILGDKQRKIKIQKMKKSINRKKAIIESLTNENTFLRHTLDKHPDWMKEV